MGNMQFNLKRMLADWLPAAAQVPVKYWSDQMRGYVEPEMRLLKHLVKKGDRVIDIGGNRGVYAYHCCKLGAVVEVFEPNPVCLQVLEPWSRGRPGITLHPVALSDHAGTAELHIPVDAQGVEHDASASIEHAAPGQARDQVVALRTLDSFGFKNVKLIKIDVEGHEYSVLKGAAATIAASRPAMLVEIEQRHCTRPIEAVFQSVLDQGYSGYFLTASGLVPITDFELARHQSENNFGGERWKYINNFLFLHHDRINGDEYASLLEESRLK